jgi:magnesium transporter
MQHTAVATRGAEELASVQREFGLPGPLVEQLGAVAKRPTLEVLGEGFVVSVDRDAAVLEQVRQDLQADPELVGAELAAVLPCVVDHAADSYGPVLGALNNAVEDVDEAVFSPDRARPTERIYRLSRQVLEFRRAVARSPRCSTAWPPRSSTAAGERLKQRYRERRAHLLHLVELADGLGNLLQANLTEVSVRQNDDMRRISAWVAIWAIRPCWPASTG